MSNVTEDQPSSDWRAEIPQFLINKCLPSPVFLDTGKALAPDSYMRLLEIQQAYCLRFFQMEPTIFLTFSFAHRHGQPASWPYKNGVTHANTFTKYKLRPPEIFDVLKRFDKELTDRVLGNQGYRLPERQRIEWWAGVEDDRHVHMLIRPPEHGRHLLRYDFGGMVRRLKIGKDAMADSIGPYERHLSCAYVVKHAWDRRIADSNERDFMFHSSYVHRDRQQ